nr:MAG TPA: hypothetical protein [Caudoviricetes sp.]
MEIFKNSKADIATHSHSTAFCFLFHFFECLRRKENGDSLRVLLRSCHALPSFQTQ